MEPRPSRDAGHPAGARARVNFVKNTSYKGLCRPEACILGHGVNGVNTAVPFALGNCSLPSWAPTTDRARQHRRHGPCKESSSSLLGNRQSSPCALAFQHVAQARHNVERTCASCAPRVLAQSGSQLGARRQRF